MKNWYLHVKMLDGSTWKIPVEVIANDRAEYYAERDNISFDKAMKETTELFESNKDEIKEWAEGNMNWSDVSSSAVMVDPGEPVDYDEGWVCGKKHIVRDEDEVP